MSTALAPEPSAPVGDLLAPDGVPAPPADRPWKRAVLAPLAAITVWVPLSRAAFPQSPLASAAGAVLLLTFAVSVYTDLRWRRIFNWVTYSAVFWAVLLQTLAAVSGPAPVLGRLTALEALGGFLAGFTVMFALYATLGGGGGDLKLVTAAGCYLGAERLVEGLCYSYVLAGVVVAGYLVWAVGPRGLLAASGRGLGVRLAPMFKMLGPVSALAVDGVQKAGLGRLYRFVLGPAPDLTRYRGLTLPMAPFYTAGLLAAVLTHR